MGFTNCQNWQLFLFFLAYISPCFVKKNRPYAFLVRHCVAWTSRQDDPRAILSRGRGGLFGKRQFCRNPKPGSHTPTSLAIDPGTSQNRAALTLRHGKPPLLPDLPSRYAQWSRPGRSPFLQLPPDYSNSGKTSRGLLRC